MISFVSILKNRVVVRLKKFIHRQTHLPFFWNVFYIVSGIFGLSSFRERLIKVKGEKLFFKHTNYNRTVLNGPFKRMVYPKLKSSYSEMAPKILGSYEAELFPPLEEIFNEPYQQILDIGCAEGFYAVGMAMRFADADIYAFDINPHALQMCKEMAEINEVAERVHLKATCTNETLRNFDFRKKSLLICDCEGYELELFTEDSIDNLRNCDLLIELHDILGISVKNKLVPLFQKTHDVKLIESKDRNPDEYSELNGLPKQDKKIILSECRDGLFGTKRMYWAYITSKK